VGGTGVLVGVDVGGAWVAVGDCALHPTSKPISIPTRMDIRTLLCLFIIPSFKNVSTFAATTEVPV
jgi:hypothetical protein